MLVLDQLDAYYGKSHILHGVSMDVREAEIVGLLGRNGMGKTTTLKAIMGVGPTRAGTITFEGRSLVDMPPHQIPRQGIAYVPQGVAVFPELTVLENLRIAFVDRPFRRDELADVFKYFPVLEQRLGQRAGTLSGGERQMLAIGRAMLSRPRLILMDEPTEGLSPLVVALLRSTLVAIKDAGVGILLVEQNLETAKVVCDRICVMEKGTIVVSGTRQHFDAESASLEEYLGVAQR